MLMLRKKNVECIGHYVILGLGRDEFDIIMEDVCSVLIMLLKK